MRWSGRLTVLMMLLQASSVLAQDASSGGVSSQVVASLPLQAPPPRHLDAVVVSGRLPGPRMWKISRQGHVLWVLGTVTPVPKRMQWESGEIDAVLAQADEVIWPPSLQFTADVGFFQGLLLAPKALGARKNPDGKLLKDVVPADAYARWVPLKAKYIGSDGGVEKWRPLFAADKLYVEAMDDHDLVRGGVLSPVIRKAIKARGLKTTSPGYKVVIADPRAALNELKQVRLDDLACFDTSLRHLETDLSAMRLRANAWAMGDIAALRSLPLSDQAEACMSAAMQSGVMRKRNQTDIHAELRTRWLDAARKALDTNKTSFAMLPIREVLKPEGYLAALQAQGYLVEAPEE